MKKIIVISGKAEAGKTSVANLLKDYFENNNKRVCIIPYAKYLKFIAKEYFGWNGTKDKENRELLQQLGSDVARTKNIDYWVDTVISFTETFKDFFDIFIIDDCRYRNEIEKWKEKEVSIITIRVERLNFKNHLTSKQQLHPSETSLDNFNFDYIIKSESGLDNLEREVNKFVEKTMA